jgi:hypothetical protein
MRVAEAFKQLSVDEVKALLDGGKLLVYSVARPISVADAVDRSGLLATFEFGTPAFGARAEDGSETPNFVEASVPGHHVGTPGFARAFKADGTPVGDFSAGPGEREIKFTEVSVTGGAPVKVAKFTFLPDSAWPEKHEYYQTRPRSGFPLPPEIAKQLAKEGV